LDIFAKNGSYLDKARLARLKYYYILDC